MKAAQIADIAKKIRLTEGAPMMTEFKDMHLSYESALHGIQCEIGYRIGLGKAPEATDPKHVRLGIDSSHICIQALVSLMIQKGVFTLDEYVEEMRLYANHELATREAAHDNQISFR